MIIMDARANNQNRFQDWLIVDKVIRTNFTKEMHAAWVKKGYDGLFTLVPAYFGMNKMYRGRGPGAYVTFEFTEEQWAIFLLRWT